jgi:hypothetical protein
MSTIASVSSSLPSVSSSECVCVCVCVCVKAVCERRSERWLQVTVHVFRFVSFSVFLLLLSLSSFPLLLCLFRLSSSATFTKMTSQAYAWGGGRTCYEISSTSFTAGPRKVAAGTAHFAVVLLDDSLVTWNAGKQEERAGRREIERGKLNRQIRAAKSRQAPLTLLSCCRMTHWSHGTQVWQTHTHTHTGRQTEE